MPHAGTRRHAPQRDAGQHGCERPAGRAVDAAGRVPGMGVLRRSSCGVVGAGKVPVRRLRCRRTRTRCSDHADPHRRMTQGTPPRRSQVADAGAERALSPPPTRAPCCHLPCAARKLPLVPRVLSYTFVCRGHEEESQPWVSFCARC
jgi:hypothetical protein